MKRIISKGLCALLAAVCALSCNPSAVLSSSSENGLEGPTGQILLRLSFPKADTRAPLSQCLENRISSVQVLVFDQESGRLENDRYQLLDQPADDGCAITLTSLVGSKLIWAVVNAPRITDAASALQLSALLSDLAHNATDCLVMSGFAQEVPVAKSTPGKLETATEITVPVCHLAARVCLDSIEADFTGSALEGAIFQVKAVYLKNVVGKVCLDGSACPSLENDGNWYNLASESAVLAAPERIRALTYDTGAQMPCALYAYPNTGTLLSTRLVVKAHLGGTTVSGAVDRDSYYVFTLPPLERNRIYRISRIGISIEGKPDDGSDSLTEAGKLESNVQVQDWDGTTLLEYEL